MHSNTLRTFSENFKDKNFPEERKKTLLIVTHKNPARIRMLSTLFQDESSNNDGQNAMFALFVNDNEEYTQGHLFGGPYSGNQHQQHGGTHDRIHHGITHAHFHNFKKSVGFTHSFLPGTTNAQTINVRIRNQDSNSRTVVMREGFLIVKEISIGLATSGSV